MRHILLGCIRTIASTNVSLCKKSAVIRRTFFVTHLN